MRTKSLEAPVNVELFLIGNSSVGKSSLIWRFLDEKFLPEDEASAIVGVDLKVYKMRMNSRKIKQTHYALCGYVIWYLNHQ